MASVAFSSVANASYVIFEPGRAGPELFCLSPSIPLNSHIDRSPVVCPS